MSKRLDNMSKAGVFKAPVGEKAVKAGFFAGHIAVTRRDDDRAKTGRGLTEAYMWYLVAMSAGACIGFACAALLASEGRMDQHHQLHRRLDLHVG